MAYTFNREILPTVAGATLLLAAAWPALAQDKLQYFTWSGYELPEFNKRHNVISTRLFAGRTVVHVLSDTNPGAGFERAPGGLEDVYLATVNASRRAA